MSSESPAAHSPLGRHPPHLLGVAAAALGVTRKTLSAVLNERAGISPAMAHRLSKALDTTPEFWVNLQAQYDLWQARETDLAGVRRLVSA